MPKLSEEQRKKFTDKQKKYWSERMALDKSFNRYQQKQLQKNALRYDKIAKSSKKTLKAFYADYGSESVVTYTDAIKVIRNKKTIVAEITKELNAAKTTGDTQYINYLKQLQSQRKITRLDALNFEIQKDVHALALENQQTTTEILTGTYERNYSAQTAILNGLTDMELKGTLYKTRIQKVVFAEFDGKNFSARIWTDTDKLANSLRSTLSDSFVRQKHMSYAVEKLEKRFDVSRSSIERLVRTESARVTEQATLESYREHEIKKYNYDATLDERTSQICEDLNGEEFLISEAVEGVNYPPMHPNCRSTTIPVI